MKTNKVILLLTATVIVVVLIVFTMILHTTIHARRSVIKKEMTYRTPPLGDFNGLVLSGHLNVRIRQGKECIVEYTAASDSLRPLIKNLNGTLHINADSSFGLSKADMASVKITMPLLLNIIADQNAEIQMGFFQADSMHITLGEGCTFKGSNNTLKEVIFKTTGDALINISSTF